MDAISQTTFSMQIFDGNLLKFFSRISSKYVLQGLIENKTSLAQVMIWCLYLVPSRHQDIIT